MTEFPPDAIWLEPDFSATGLWHFDEGYGVPLEEDEYPFTLLSDETKRRLQAWQNWFEAEYDPNDFWRSDRRKRDFENESWQLWRAIRDELSPDVEVGHVLLYNRVYFGDSAEREYAERIANSDPAATTGAAQRHATGIAAPTNLRVTWLLGSGISVPLGMPSVGDISDRVRSGRGVAQHTDATYFVIDPPPASHSAMVTRVTNLVRVLDDEFERNRRPWEPPANYEDWYYLASQVHHYLTDEYENPALRRMVGWLRTTTSAIRQPKRGETLVGELDLVSSMREVMTYIESIVRHELAHRPVDLAPLKCLADALRDLRRQDLVVLNHDLATELLCVDVGVTMDDGFGDDENGVRYWRGHRLDGRSKLIKPHGSVNWYDFAGNHTGIPLDGDPWHAKSRGGDFLLPVGGTPATLIGTTNKLLEYHRGVAFESQVAFYLSLGKADRVIVAGYGFRDKGVNSRLIRWLSASTEHRMIVIDPKPFATARPAMVRMRDQLVPSGQIVEFAEGFDEVNWEDIKRALGPNGAGPVRRMVRHVARKLPINWFALTASAVLRRSKSLP